MKLFADLERKRRETENKISSEAAKTREAQLQAEEKKTVEKEFHQIGWKYNSRIRELLIFSTIYKMIIP